MADRYRDAGVDVEAGDRFVGNIAPLAASTARPGADGGLGGFGGLFDLAATGYRDPILVAATDGVGTKVEMAAETGLNQGVGIDLVAMCVNDLVVQGAEPLFFLDYFATGKLEPAAAEAVVAGIAQGCKTAGCALIGGETAEMPGLYAPGHFDLAGFAVGAAERGNLLDGSHIAAGDLIVGLASDGVHANGFSLVRRIVADAGCDLSAPPPFPAQALSLGAALMTPTRLYVASCLAAHQAGLVTGLAHITGGALVTNPPRVLPRGLSARIDLSAWELPPVFGWLADTGGLDRADLIGTFNCGLGMLAYVRPDRLGVLRQVLATYGETVHVVGEVIEGDGAPDAEIVNDWPNRA